MPEAGHLLPGQKPWLVRLRRLRISGLSDCDDDVLTSHVAMRIRDHIIPHVASFVKAATKIYPDEGSVFKLLTERYGYEYAAAGRDVVAVLCRSLRARQPSEIACAQSQRFDHTPSNSDRGLAEPFQINRTITIA